MWVLKTGDSLVIARKTWKESSVKMVSQSLLPFSTSGKQNAISLIHINFVVESYEIRIYYMDIILIKRQ